jgi:hypothetical protein
MPMPHEEYEIIMIGTMSVRVWGNIII